MSTQSNPNPYASEDNPLTIAHDDMARLAGGNALHVIDVREPHEYAAGHVVGAKNHPLSAFDPAKLPIDKPVALICGAGGRSLKALQAAHSVGRTDIIHYLPGTRGWIERGGKVEK